jgi:rsbT co-antagonist protein RsbR
MAAHESAVQVSGGRIEHILTAVALASTGSFDGALSSIETTAEDDFGILEEALRVFLTELKNANLDATEALERLTVSKRELERKLDTIAAQRVALRELSTPIIDVWEGVLTLPLIGFIDTERAADITESLLHRVTEAHARWVLIDLTGLTAVDEATADYLIRLVDTVSLIGSQCILTGIGAKLALQLMELGPEIHGLRTMRTLREGLHHCIHRSRK